MALCKRLFAHTTPPATDAQADSAVVAAVTTWGPLDGADTQAVLASDGAYGAHISPEKLFDFSDWQTPYRAAA